jgi:hypothetical protein
MFFRPLLAALLCAGLLSAIDSDRDFSGKWILDPAASDVRSPDVLTVTQSDSEIRCSDGAAEWSYALSGAERKYRVGSESRNSVVKWEGAALLVNTIVSGPRDYVIMDRWRLSQDHGSLTITRQIVRNTGQDETRLVYRREGYRPPARPSEPPPVARPVAPRPVTPRPAAPLPAPEPLARREGPPEPTEYVVPAGTHIPLTFRNTVDAKHAREGDRIYLETAFPVSQNGRVVIPRGSFVNGTVTQIKLPGRSSKGELMIRFDTLALPNGVKRDFRSRPATGEEGSITAEGNDGHSPRSVGAAAGTGATVGVITGGAAGHAGMGAGIGGAAAGLASVLMSRGPNAVLPQGTTVDMLLDRDLRFRPDDLR